VSRDGTASQWKNGRVPSANEELVRRGFEAAARGDLDAVADLLDPEVKWHGGDPDSGCRNRVEALEFIRRGLRRPLGRLIDVIDVGEDRFVVVLQPRGEEGGPAPAPRANVTTVRDGRVVEMVAYETPEQALAATASG
jgi:ketosteroid isomerase-like protein